MLSSREFCVRFAPRAALFLDGLWDTLSADDKEEIQEMRNDEVMVLESMYGEEAVDKRADGCITLSLQLPIITQVFQTRKDAEAALERGIGTSCFA